MSKSGSSGSESDVEISESYRKRLAERAAMVVVESSPSNFRSNPSHRRLSESQDGILIPNETRADGRRESFGSDDKLGLEEQSSNRPGVDVMTGEVRRRADIQVAAAVATMDRRLRRPLKARESESMLLPNE